MSKTNDFHSLLSVFQDATSSSRESVKSATVKSSGACEQNRVTGNRHRNTAQKTPSRSSPDASPTAQPVALDSAKDPSFSAPLLKERIERILRIREIRRSTSNGSAIVEERSNDEETKKSFHVAVCATIVDEFPHEILWRKWMEETGGEFVVDDSAWATTNNDATGERSGECGDGGGKCDGKESESNESEPRRIMTSSELYVHAKNPERVRSEWLRSKTLPISHRPNWNDVRIIRSILSLIEAALRDERTTHVLLCTESCVPVATLKETAESVLLDEICRWEETEEGRSGEGRTTRGKRDRRRLDWNRSYADCYDGNSSRCTRFDEHNCWGILKDSIPAEAIYKALPGWCFLSRKHARDILDIPTRLGGLNLWPAFERVWAPEEVFLPTALSLCGNVDEVSRRALTHCQWDERAADHEDRAHPLSYDGRFDDELVSRVRRNGCLFLRKMKRPLDVSVWDRVVIQRRKGQDSTGTVNSEQELKGGRDRERGSKRDWGRERDRHGHLNDHDRSYHTRARNDSWRGHDTRRRNEDDHQRQKRERGPHSRYDNFSKRKRW